jgi:hypothetical protein
MNLELAPQQNNSAPDIEPLLQEWSPVPGLTEFSFFLTGGSILIPKTRIVKIKDLIGFPSFSNYTNFKLRALKIYNEPNNAWLSVFCPEIGVSTTEASVVYENGMNCNLTLTIVNPNLLTAGVYNSDLRFSIYADNPLGTSILLGQYSYKVRLSVYAINAIVNSPSVINITHYQNTGLPSVPITMNGNQWTVLAPRKYILATDDPEVAITSNAIGSDLIYKATGSGERIVNLSLSAYFNTQHAVNSNHLNAALNILTGATLIRLLPIHVTLENENAFVVTPATLSFVGVKGILEPVAKFLFVFSQEVYSMVYPPWLNIESGYDQSGNYSQEGKNVVPISTANMEGGIYSDTIIFNSVIAGVPSQIAVPVTYTLFDVVTYPFSENEFNYTLDKNYIRFSSEAIDTYFDMLVICKVFDFYTFQEKEFFVPIKIPLFNGMQAYNIGQGIHRLMKKVKELDIYSINKYKPAQVKFEVKEKSNLDDSIIRSIASPTFQFIAGHRPSVMENHAILSSSEPIRVTKKGFQFLNLVVPIGALIINIFKNGVIFSEYVFSASENIVTDRIEFSLFEPGDVVEYRVVIGDDFISKKFIVFPEGIESKMIIWENKYLLKSCFEFTGKFQVKSDLETKSNTRLEDLAELLTIFETKKISKLTINTGFISKYDISQIDDLMSSQRAWIILADEKLVEIVPISKTFLPNDSDRELIAFDIEFQINRKYNEEVYTF